MAIPDLASSDSTSLVASLLRHLLDDELPLPFSHRTGTDTIIDATRAAIAADPDFPTRLSGALGEILRTVRDRITSPGEDDEAIVLAGKVAFVATELGLHLGSDDLIDIAGDAIPRTLETRNLDAALLQVVRAVGRAGHTAIPLSLHMQLRNHPGRGIRTFAAQHIARSDPDDAVRDLYALMALNINGPLLAHTLLQAAGSARDLAAMSARYPETALLLSRLLAETGEAEASAMVAAASHPPVDTSR